MEPNPAVDPISQPPVTVPPAPIPPPVQKSTHPIAIVVGIIVLLLLVSGIAYYAGTQQNKPVAKVKQTVPAIYVTPKITQPSPIKEVTWKAQQIMLEQETMIRGKQTITMEMQLPSDWTFKSTPLASDAANIIQNCSEYTLMSNDQTMKVSLQPICKGWAATTSSWPDDGVIVNQKNCSGNDGAHTCYRVRRSVVPNEYTYVDSITEPNRPMDNTKDKVMDALMIGYPAPNENKDDFFFIAAILKGTFSGNATQRESFLTITDKIATSLTLK